MQNNQIFNFDIKSTEIDYIFKIEKIKSLLYAVSFFAPQIAHFLAITSSQHHLPLKYVFESLQGSTLYW